MSASSFFATIAANSSRALCMVFSMSCRKFIRGTITRLSGGYRALAGQPGQPANQHHPTWLATLPIAAASARPPIDGVDIRWRELLLAHFLRCFINFGSPAASGSTVQ